MALIVETAASERVFYRTAPSGGVAWGAQPPLQGALYRSVSGGSSGRGEPGCPLGSGSGAFPAAAASRRGPVCSLLRHVMNPDDCSCFFRQVLAKPPLIRLLCPCHLLIAVFSQWHCSFAAPASVARLVRHPILKGGHGCGTVYVIYA